MKKPRIHAGRTLTPSVSEWGGVRFSLQGPGLVRFPPSLPKTVPTAFHSPVYQGNGEIKVGLVAKAILPSFLNS